MDSIRLHPRLLADRQALFEQGTCRLQLALLQVDESQQTERIDAEGSIAPFPKVGQALLGQLLGARLVLLLYKEQARLQVAHPAKALRIAQRLVEQQALLQQCMGLFVLPLFGGGARPFGRALALPPAITQFLEAGCSFLQMGLGQHKLTPGTGDTPQLTEAGGYAHRITQLLVERQTLLSQVFERQGACLQERRPRYRIQHPRPPAWLPTNTPSPDPAPRSSPTLPSTCLS